MLRPIQPERTVSAYQLGFIAFYNSHYKEAIPHFKAMSGLAKETEKIIVAHEFLTLCHIHLADVENAYNSLEKLIKYSDKKQNLLILFIQIYTVTSDKGDPVAFLLNVHSKNHGEHVDAFILGALKIVLDQLPNQDRKDVVLMRLPAYFKEKLSIQ